MTVKNSRLRDLLDLPLTPEVDGMVRIWMNVETARATAGGGMPATEGSAPIVRRQVLTQLVTIPSASIYDGLAKLSVWQSAMASGLQDELVEELAGTAVEELVALARACARRKRYRAD